MPLSRLDLPYYIFGVVEPTLQILGFVVGSFAPQYFALTQAPLLISHSLLPSEKILSYQLGFGSTTKRRTARHSAVHAILSVVIKDGDDLAAIHKTRMAELGRSVSAPLQVVIDDSSLRRPPTVAMF
ncbi:hypothetical protein SAPIO_CDS2659 [Scedosporium apiospermum]|uniref:Uncharacterized protein n=1 Tax=Pseudallescheria apiosperma TaxID=563466 RepID=A0A084GCY8_PSEDA|nr:uncharacterized protein SAPIO_CDS2659 [Scedosporium apiospermum]KEZ45200.1 hypothetical protein SAPIO_CDS2659 [Scedosporium apiospermum]